MFSYQQYLFKIIISWINPCCKVSSNYSLSKTWSSNTTCLLPYLSVRITTSLLNITDVVYVNFIHEWRLRTTDFWETFHDNYIFNHTEFLPNICWKHFPNRKVISVRICIAFHILKTNLCYITPHWRFPKRGFYVLLRFESPVFVFYERNTNKSLDFLFRAVCVLNVNK